MGIEPFLQNRKMNLREVKFHAQGHPASKWQYQIVKLSSLQLKTFVLKSVVPKLEHASNHLGGGGAC